MVTLNGLLITAVLALAVKQLSYALLQGSMFEPLRKSIRKGMRNGTIGFETLSELFSCKLCMSMQISLWVVVVPGLFLGLRFHVSEIVFGSDTSPLVSVSFLVLGAFLYGMAVSGIALELWVRAEYPAKRYEDLALELRNAQEQIADLQQLSLLDQSSQPQNQ